MLGGSGRTGCDSDCFSGGGGWTGRGSSLTGMLLCQRVLPVQPLSRKNEKNFYFLIRVFPLFSNFLGLLISFLIAGKTWISDQDLLSQARQMWKSMSDETKAEYGEDYFEQAVRSLETYTKGEVSLHFFHYFNLYHCLNINLHFIIFYIYKVKCCF